MEEASLVLNIIKDVKSRLEGESSGHDWWHVHRVWVMAERIGREEKANLTVVELAALLHDIADWKFNDGDETAGPRVAKEILLKYGTPQEIVEPICKIISEISFKGAGVKILPSTLEGEIVQDADRLDAIGAIGIARAFAYGGSDKRIMHDPKIKPVFHKNKEEYFKNQSTTINHFYEKLLLLKDFMNTKTAQKIAVERHKFMQNYLDEFFQEWEGKI